MKDFHSITHAQQIERWGNVLRVLQAMTPHARRKHWDMYVFGLQTDCGTIACAAGHCSFDPWFRRRGYKGIWIAGTLYTPKETSFFGSGARSIFYNITRRSVGTVIREVRAHIKQLKLAAEEERIDMAALLQDLQ